MEFWFQFENDNSDLCFKADLALLGVAALHTVRVPVGRLQQGGGTHVTCSRTSKTWRPGFQMGKKKIVCGGERQEFVWSWFALWRSNWDKWYQRFFRRCNHPSLPTIHLKIFWPCKACIFKSNQALWLQNQHWRLNHFASENSNILSTMDKNLRCYMHLWCRFYYYYHSYWKKWYRGSFRMCRVGREGGGGPGQCGWAQNLWWYSGCKYWFEYHKFDGIVWWQWRQSPSQGRAVASRLSLVWKIHF